MNETIHPAHRRFFGTMLSATYILVQKMALCHHQSHHALDMILRDLELLGQEPQWFGTAKSLLVLVDTHAPHLREGRELGNMLFKAQSWEALGAGKLLCWEAGFNFTV